MNFWKHLWKELILLILHLETYLISVLDCFEKKRILQVKSEVIVVFLDDMSFYLHPNKDRNIFMCDKILLLIVYPLAKGKRKETVVF